MQRYEVIFDAFIFDGTAFSYMKLEWKLLKRNVMFRLTHDIYIFHEIFKFVILPSFIAKLMTVNDKFNS